MSQDWGTSSQIPAPSCQAGIIIRTNTGGGFEGDNSTVINGEESFQLNFRAGTVARIAEPDYATTSGPFVRVTPALLVRTLKDREANAHYLGETSAVSSTKTFAEALAGLDIEVTKIVSAHSARVGTMQDLQDALEAEVYQASR